MHIRQFQNNDSLVELTSLLHRGYARLGAMGLNYTAVDQAPTVTAARIAGGKCFVAVASGKFVGTVLVKPPERDSACEYFRKGYVASLRQFAVDPIFQGQGIGARLIATCEQWAKDAGYTELALDTAEPATHLVDLYSRLGFLAVGSVQWTGKVYKSVVMSKVIR